jgi:hypothetical protein
MSDDQLERDRNGYFKKLLVCDRHGFRSWMSQCPHCEQDAVKRAIAFVRDDSIAATYQSMGQYRTAILNVLEGKK